MRLGLVICLRVESTCEALEYDLQEHIIDIPVVNMHTIEIICRYIINILEDRQT